jgi:hypothetical protein
MNIFAIPVSYFNTLKHQIRPSLSTMNDNYFTGEMFKLHLQVNNLISNQFHGNIHLNLIELCRSGVGINETIFFVEFLVILVILFY